MSLNESGVEDAALEWFLLRQGFCLHQGVGGQDGGTVGDPPSPHPPPRLWRSGRIRWTGLSYAVGRETIRRLNLPISSRALDTLRDPAGAGLPKRLSGELSVADFVTKMPSTH